MVPNTSRSRARSAVKKKPIVWTFVAIGLIVGYILLQPVVERKLGIQLPRLLNDEPAAKDASPVGNSGAEGQDRKSITTKNQADTKTSAPNPDHRSGVLRDIGGKVSVSPAGLRYGPGSLEGHRVQHVLRHAQDDTGRPIHGVFDGTEDEIWAVIDEAYLIAKKAGPRVEAEREGKRTIYTVDLRRRIGYLGGQSGRRSKHPAATSLRLVLEGTNVITAFPVKP